MRVRVKICGITSPEAARAVALAGADAAGFVFADSPRRVTPGRARELATGLPPFVARVAVFRHPEPDQVREAIEAFGPQFVQCEPDDRVLGVLPREVVFLPVLHDGDDVLAQVERHLGHEHPPALLLEAAGRGGRGIAPDWARAGLIARRARLVLAGGLTPDNVGEAIRLVRPYAVDVSSGVESRTGMKDPARIAEFVAAVREAEAEPHEVERQA